MTFRFIFSIIFPMENFLNYISLNFFELQPEYIKIITFFWNITKCTVLFVIAVKFLRWFLDKFFKNITTRLDSQERIQQLLTLKTITIHTFQVIVFLIYIANMLYLFGIDVRPLLATAGVLGVALGFGAKRFVEDIITGLIILVEGQIRVGDYIEVDNMSGFVEKITLPMVTVRSDKTGAVYFIRCGYIDTVINHTMGYAYAYVPVEVAYKEDLTKVYQTIKNAYNKLIKHPEYKAVCLNEIEIFGLDEFKESSLLIKCRIKTAPKSQWKIKREFNKIIKEEFEKENIEIPFNQLVVTTLKED